MKVEFVDGTYKYKDGDATIWSNKHQSWVLGRYCRYEKEWCLKKKHARRVITVVKQKTMWRTFKVLYHELMHWIFDTILPQKLCDRLDDWLDRD